MRMTASWSGHYGPTEYKVVVAMIPQPDGKAPPLIFADHNQACRRARACQGAAWKLEYMGLAQTDGRP
jgi:hypothetical protein